MRPLLDAPALRDQWYVVAESADVADHQLAVTLLAERYVLWRDPTGAVVAAADRCPHRQAPLSEGTVSGGCLTCPYHGWTFGTGGRCVEVPSAGADAHVPPAAHLATLHIIERYGLVWISPGAPTSNICVIAEDSDPAFRRINTGVEVWRTHATRMVDNFLDVAHFPWVHSGTFGMAQERVTPAIEIVELDSDFTGYRYEVEVKDGAGHDLRRAMTTGFHLPFTVRSTIRHVTGSEAGLDHILLLCSTPIDHESSMFTFVVWRNDDHVKPAERVVEFDRAIGAEDKRMLERIDGELPLDLRATVSVQADRASVEWRRRLAGLSLSLVTSPAYSENAD
jgi:phenylpropionate dioxygenase-like ring-hydroxylating dioxygenase large terminal subunit